MTIWIVISIVAMIIIPEHGRLYLMKNPTVSWWRVKEFGKAI